MTLKYAVFNNEWMNWADFFHVDANLGKPKVTLRVMGGHGQI